MHLIRKGINSQSSIESEEGYVTRPRLIEGVCFKETVRTSRLGIDDKSCASAVLFKAGWCI